MEHHEFPSELCCLTIPKKFVKEPFGVSKSFVYRKVFCISGVYHKFLSKVICLSLPRIFVVEIFCDSVKFWYREVLQIREKFHDFPSKVFLFYRTIKLRRGHFLCSRKIRVSRKVRDKRRDITTLRRKYFLSQDREIS